MRDVADEIINTAIDVDRTFNYGQPKILFLTV